MTLMTRNGCFMMTKAGCTLTHPGIPDLGLELSFTQNNEHVQTGAGPGALMNQLKVHVGFLLKQP